jgi:hypothetical protein
MEAASTCGALAVFCQITQHYSPEDSHLHVNFGDVIDDIAPVEARKFYFNEYYICSCVCI